MIKPLFLLITGLVLGTPEDYAELAWDYGRAHSVDPIRVVALMHTETGGTYNPRAYNERSGAVGLMQLMPFWARRFGFSRSDLFDPESNILIGVKTLKYMKTNFVEKCSRYQPRRVCVTRLTPLHFYRCSTSGATSRQCARSVRAVTNVERLIRTSYNNHGAEETLQGRLH